MNLDYKLLSEDDIRLRRSPAKFIFMPGSNLAKEMADKLFEAMIQNNGVGLSANQVGINMQFFVMGFEDGIRRYIFNPEILEQSNDEVLIKEGCLSFPGMFLPIKRSSAIKVRYQNEFGEFQEETLVGLSARIFLHEYDHMIGKVFTEKVSKLKLDLANKKRAKFLKRYVVKIANKAIVEAKQVNV